MAGELRINGHVVGQPPNAPLWAAFAGFAAAIVFADGSTAEDVSRGVAYCALAVWAYLELSDGVNAYRRLLGAAGLIFAVALVARAIA